MRRSAFLRRVARFILALVVVPVAVSCLGSGPTGVRRSPGDDDYTWLLFIGNSHTYVYDVPAMVEQLAAMAGDRTIRTHRIAEANFALEDHWNIGVAREALERYGWNYVIMQQGPSSLPANQEHLRYWTTQFAPYVRGAGAVPVLYQVWPASDRRQDAPNVLLSYRNAAAAVEGILAPAGDAFSAALEVSPLSGVYAQDGFHASQRGAYLAALSIVSRLLDIDPRTLPARIPGGNVDEAVVRQLQDAAAVALARNPARP